MRNTAATARLVAPAGRALRTVTRLPCTAFDTVDLTAVAAAANEHLNIAAGA